MRTAAEAADELEAFGRFYGSLAAREYFGEHVCLAAHPDHANGSVEDLVEHGVEAGAAITAGWTERILDAVDDRSTPGSILTALGNLELDLTPFARIVEQSLMHSAMLGVLDSEWERQHDEEIAPARFAADIREGAFTSVPFLEARSLFERRQVLPKAAFDALEQGARRQAFTVARMASAEMLNVTKAELARQLSQARERPIVDQDDVARRGGFNLRDFRRFAKDRLESAGWTPANKSHVETVFRTNAVGALASGRFVEMRKPDVLAALPYWQIRGVNDSRARPTHKAAFGIILPANHPFWLTAYPPWGFNCRCACIARSKRWLERSGKPLGPVPKNLPDPGWESKPGGLISIPPVALEQPTPPAPSAPQAPTSVPGLHPPLPPAPPPSAVPAPWLDDNTRAAGAAEILKQSAASMASMFDEGVLEPAFGGPVRRFPAVVRQHTQAFLRQLVPDAVSRDGVQGTLFSREGLVKKRGAWGLQIAALKRIDLDEKVRKAAKRALKRIAKGEFAAPRSRAISKAATDDLWGLQVYLHEEAHGFSRNLTAYRGVAKVLEEVGTEVTAREALLRAAPGLGTAEVRQALAARGAYQHEINEVLDVVMKHTGDNREAALKRIVHAHGKIVGPGAPIETPDEHLREFVAGLDLTPERAQLVIADLKALPA